MSEHDASFDVAIVGAGIVGLAHAWAAIRRGLRVIVLERHAAATGASVRNFGMVLPIAQPPGQAYETALRSRELWLELAEVAFVWVNECGSIHLAHHDDEWAVLRDFADSSAIDGDQRRLLTAGEVIELAPAANPDGLRGGLWSSTELGINPRTALTKIAEWLTAKHDVTIRFNTRVTSIETGQLETSSGQTFRADRIIVCSGDEMRLLFPEELGKCGLRLCKLQMMRTDAQPDNWRLGPHLASGLTLRHYRVFERCASFPTLKARIAEETPELDRYGIHVLASQNDRGEVILGDSHEYDADITPERNPEIDELILREVRKIIRLPDWTIADRWHGQYVKHPTQSVVELEPTAGVRIVTGFDGAGMTLALGWADLNWK
ncbi:MAG: TIGR03364 family FAD-dependent oxidoreductase [Planctomycetaceae bacterium]|nr:TIGR03364 family FAD-dependent oxidoreductase [Planctomycetaceae bacterium]